MKLTGWLFSRVPLRCPTATRPQAWVLQEDRWEEQRGDIHPDPGLPGALCRRNHGRQSYVLKINWHHAAYVSSPRPRIQP